MTALSVFDLQPIGTVFVCVDDLPGQFGIFFRTLPSSQASVCLQQHSPSVDVVFELSSSFSNRRSINHSSFVFAVDAGVMRHTLLNRDLPVMSSSVSFVVVL